MQRFSYISNPRSTPYTYCSFIDIYKENLRKYPNKELAIHRGPGSFRKVLRNSELDASATRLAKYLVQKGVRKSDHVAIFGPNTLEWIIGELAILMSGAVSVPVTINIKDPVLIQRFLDNACCKTLIIDPGENEELNDIVQSLLSHFAEQIRNKEDFVSPSIIFLRQSKLISNFVDLASIENESIANVALPVMYPEETSVIFPTSGSTGEPKLVKHSHFTLMNGLGFAESSIKVYNDRPFSWLGGNPLFSVCYGYTLVFTDATLALKPGSADVVWKFIETENCTHALLLPYLLIDLLQNAKAAKKTWRLDTLMTTGQIIDANIAHVIGQFCKQMIVGYGTTETLSICSGKLVTDPNDYEVGNVGLIFPGTELKIMSEEGILTSKGDSGKILCRSRHMLHGYFRKDDFTSVGILNDGWFDTGDIGYINSSEELVIEGRVKDVISRGTRKIFPSPIEDIILTMPHIKKVLVIGVPDDRLLEEICACYVADENYTVSPTDLENFCMRHFAVEDSFDGLGDMPRYFVQFRAFPMLENGKPDKQTLRLETKVKLNLNN